MKRSRIQDHGRRASRGGWGGRTNQGIRAAQNNPLGRSLDGGQTSRVKGLSQPAGGTRTGRVCNGRSPKEPGCGGAVATERHGVLAPQVG